MTQTKLGAHFAFEETVYFFEVATLIIPPSVERITLNMIPNRKHTSEKIIPVPNPKVAKGIPERF